MRNLVFLFALLAMLSGCSSGGDSSSNESPGTNTVQPSNNLPADDQTEASSDSIAFNTPFAVESKIVGEFKGYAFDFVFELENGQLWQQTTNKYIGYTASDPSVVIFHVSDELFKMHVIGTDDIVAVKPVSDISTTPPVDIAAEAVIQNEFSGWAKSAIFDLSIGAGEFWQQTSGTSEHKTLSRPAAILYGNRGQTKLVVVGMSQAVSVRQLTDENGSVDDPAPPVDDTPEPEPEPEPTNYPPSPVPSTALILNNSISGQFSGFANGNVFKLGNGQIWEQTGYDIHYYNAFSPEVIIYSDTFDYKMFVKGANRIVTVKPLTSIASTPAIETYINSLVTSDFKGFESGAIFVLNNGSSGTWEQTSYDYQYHYAYRPQAIVFGSPSGYKMLIPSMSAYVTVKPL